MSGFGRRPQWNDPRTPSIAALNVWKAKEQQTHEFGEATIYARRNRTFTDNWPLNIQGHKTNRLAKGNQNQEDTNQGRQQEEGNPKRPRADHTQQKQESTTVNSSKRKREEDDELIDPHIPLPTMKRKDKSNNEEGKPSTPTAAKTRPNKRKADNQLDEERRSPDEASSSKGMEGGCTRKEFDKKKSLENANRQGTNSYRCIQCNNKPRRGEIFSDCPGGPVWMGFKPNEPICDLCKNSLQKNLKAYASEKGMSGTFHIAS